MEVALLIVSTGALVGWVDKTYDIHNLLLLAILLDDDITFASLASLVVEQANGMILGTLLFGSGFAWSSCSTSFGRSFLGFWLLGCPAAQTEMR